MSDPADISPDEALDECERVLDAILAGDAEAWAGAWAPQSALALTEALYGPEGIQQLLDDGLNYRDYLLVGCDRPPHHLTIEGILLGQPGPLPFTVVQHPEPPYLLVNLLRSGLALASTMDHVAHLEQLPHRPAPELLLPARAALNPTEMRLVGAFDGLPGGWRSSACALAVWRALAQRAQFGAPPPTEALLAAVCYQTGPWRLLPLVPAAEWCAAFEVTSEQFEEAWQYLDHHLELKSDYYCYMPKLPESGFLPSPGNEGDLMTLVSGFLNSLEDEDDEDYDEYDYDEDYDDSEGEDEDEQDGLFPLFPEDN